MPSVSELIESVSPYYKKLKGPSEEHKLIYDSSSETLEPVYFWILDWLKGPVGPFGGKDAVVEKIVDNFTPTPGSGHFAELGARATRMQEEGMKILGAVNTVIKSILNLIYDLKEFQMRLSSYDAANSKDKEKSAAGILAIKGIWMDNVDIKRGRGSINALAQDLQFVTIRDAFMAAESAEKVDSMDLNDRVKRLLKPRLQEFFEWKKRSETELRKRYSIEKTYLRSQVNSLQMYTRWAKPYLKAAEELTGAGAGREPELVKVFNTLLLQLTLLARSKIKIQEESVDKNLPEIFRDIKLKRDYYYCVLVDFVFRGIPQRVTQQPHFAFGGRVEVKFKAYALNQDEIDLLNEKLQESDIEDALKLVQGVTDDTLKQIQDDLKEFLKDTDLGKEEEKKQEGDVNPFSALFGFGAKAKKDKKAEEKKAKEDRITKLKEKGVEKDSYQEELVRKVAEYKSKVICFKVFDIYKKGHDMASHPDPYV